MGEEFQIWWSTSAHPKFNSWLTFPTATLVFAPGEDKIEEVRFDNGLKQIREGFLGALYEVYCMVKGWGDSSVVTAWALRAAFCFHRRCAPAVFNRLFEENYNGSDEFEIAKDFPRNKPPHEDALILGGRQIGLIRMARR
jgi:hypothetical protein